MAAVLCRSPNRQCAPRLLIVCAVLFFLAVALCLFVSASRNKKTKAPLLCRSPKRQCATRRVNSMYLLACRPFVPCCLRVPRAVVPPVARFEEPSAVVARVGSLVRLGSVLVTGSWGVSSSLVLGGRPLHWFLSPFRFGIVMSVSASQRVAHRGA